MLLLLLGVLCCGLLCRLTEGFNSFFLGGAAFDGKCRRLKMFMLCKLKLCFFWVYFQKTCFFPFSLLLKVVFNMLMVQ